MKRTFLFIGVAVADLVVVAVIVAVLWVAVGAFVDWVNLP